MKDDWAVAVVRFFDEALFFFEGAFMVAYGTAIVLGVAGVIAAAYFAIFAVALVFFGALGYGMWLVVSAVFGAFS